jgi:hypothetical protein
MAEQQDIQGKPALIPRGIESVNYCRKEHYDFVNCTQSIFDICNYDRYRNDPHKLLVCHWIRALVLLAITAVMLNIMSYTLHRSQF